MMDSTMSSLLAGKGNNLHVAGNSPLVKHYGLVVLINVATVAFYGI
jgi:hypothetical protein